LHAEDGEWYCPSCAKEVAVQSEHETEVQEQMNTVMTESCVDPKLLDPDVSSDEQDISRHDMLEARDDERYQEQDVQKTFASETPVVETVEVAPFEIPTPNGKSQTPEPQTQPEQAKISLPGMYTPPASRDPTLQLPSSPGEPETTATVLQASEEPHATTNDDIAAGLPSEEVNNNEKIAPTQEQPTQSHCITSCTGDEDGPMIACDDDNCPRQWYHYACVNVTRKPRKGKTWYCPTCLPQHTESPNSGRKPRPSRATLSQPPQPQKTAGQKRTRQAAELEYCNCGMPASDDMIACDANCARQWFHFACVGLTADTVPEGAWYCEECAVEEERRKKKKGGKRRR
jgi:hypothetical protein